MIGDDTGPRMLGLPARLAWALLAAIVFAAVFTAAGTYSWFNDDDHADEETPLEESRGEKALTYVVGSIIPTLVAAGVVAYTGNRLWRGAGRSNPLAVAALVFGILACLSLPAFWTGIYAPFGAGALVLGAEALGRGVEGGRRIMAGAGMLLGAAGIVISALANLFG